MTIRPLCFKAFLTTISLAWLLAYTTQSYAAGVTLTVSNNTAEELFLVNTVCPPGNPVCGSTPQQLSLCPKASTTPKCPSSVNLVLSNESGQTSTVFNWLTTDSPISKDSEFGISVQSNGGEPCDNSGTPGAIPCYCTPRSDSDPGNNAADKYGIISVKNDISGRTISIDTKGTTPYNCSLQSAPPISAGTAPLQVINVNQNYFYAGSVDKSRPLADLSSYFTAQGLTPDKNTTLTVKQDSAIAKLLVGATLDGNIAGKVYVNQASISLSDYDNIKSSISENSQCTTSYTPPGETGADPYKIKCDVTVTANSSDTSVTPPTVTFPVVLNAGISKVRVADLMAQSLGPEPKSKLLSYLVEISAQPGDFIAANNNSSCQATDATGKIKKQGVSIVALNLYFNLGQYDPRLTPTPTRKVHYSFDASHVAAGSTVSPDGTDAIKRISSVNAVAHGNKPPSSTDLNGNAYANGRFYINNVPGKPGTNLCFDTSNNNIIEEGIYQINIKAQGMSSNSATTADPGEVAYTTFYINVNQSNPSHACWAYKGDPSHCSGSGGNKFGIAQTNLFNNSYDSAPPSPMIGAYTYSANDYVSDNTKFINTYIGYSQDIRDINSNYGKNAKPINTMLAEVMELQYTDTNSGLPLGFWPANNKGEVVAGAIGIDEPDIDKWLPFLAEQIQATSGGSVGLTVNFAFTNATKADFSAYNQQQIDLATDLMVSTIMPNNTASDGMSLDLEGGLNSAGAAEFYKALADKLAFQGKWFSLYYFSNMFTPDVIASFGPLGVALISGYDVATYHSMYNPDDRSKFYSSWSDEDISNYENVYKHAESCASDQGTKTISWCNINTNNAAAENDRLWTTVFADTIWNDPTKTPGLTNPRDAFSTINGKYQVVMPVSWSATVWSYIELFNPDLSAYVTTQPAAHPPYCSYLSKSDPKPSMCLPSRVGYIFANSNQNACSEITNDWLKQNDTKLDPTSPSYVKSISEQLKSCLFSNVLIGGAPIQSFRRCSDGTGANQISYDKCMLVSAIPGSTPNSDGKIITPTQKDYLASIAPVYYMQGPNYVGTSMYAFDNFEAAPNNGAFLCNDGEINMKAVQQPWYVGKGHAIRKGNPGCGDNEIPYDPFYGTKEYNTIVDNAWTAFFQLNPKQ